MTETEQRIMAKARRRQCVHTIALSMKDAEPYARLWAQGLLVVGPHGTEEMDCYELAPRLRSPSTTGDTER